MPIRESIETLEENFVENIRQSNCEFLSNGPKGDGTTVRIEKTTESEKAYSIEADRERGADQVRRIKSTESHLSCEFDWCALCVGCTSTKYRHIIRNKNCVRQPSELPWRIWIDFCCSVDWVFKWEKDLSSRFRIGRPIHDTHTWRFICFFFSQQQ